jgi:sulfur relay (sulfurtransferase) DsrF/TusC family protein
LNAPAPDLALLVAAAPFARREPRAELDVALAAAALDARLEVFFLGDALLQLARERDVAPAGLAAGYRGWAALPELGDVRVFAEAAAVERCRAAGIDLVLPVETLAAEDLRRRWRCAARAMVL